MLDLEDLFVAHLRRVASLEDLSIELESTAHDMHIGEPTRVDSICSFLVLVEQAGKNESVRMNDDRTIAAIR